MSRWGFFKQALRAVLPALAGLLLASTSAHAADEYLDPEQAFRLSARALDTTHIEVRFDIAPGYYLYHERLNAQLAPEGLKLAELRVPKGKVKYDQTFEKDVEYFRDAVTLVAVLKEAPSGPFTLSVGNQGCADKGLCYSPQSRAFQVEPGQGPGGTPRFTLLNEAQAAAWSPTALVGSSLSSALSGAISGAAPQSSEAQVGAAANPEDAGEVAKALKSGNTALVIGLFLLLGLGLSFTPCVLPMMPILSSIIVGRGGPVSKARGFSLALAYSLGMALVYTAFGVASALAGEGLGAALQNVWVLGGFAIVLAIFSLSMFGVYELQMPASLQNKLTEASQGFKGGQHLGVFAMGGISSLIVGPCAISRRAGDAKTLPTRRFAPLGSARRGASRRAS